MKRTLVALSVASLLLLTACGTEADDGQTGSGADGAGDASSSSSAAPVDADQLVLRVEQTGGFVPPGWQFTAVPGISLYADGRLLTPGPQIEIFPGPAMPNVQVTKLSPEQVQALLDAVQTAGIDGTKRDWGQPPVADVPDTVITLVVDGKRIQATIPALGVGDGTEPAPAPDPGAPAAGQPADATAPTVAPAAVSPAQQEARKKVLAALAKVSRLAGAEQAYRPRAVAVLAQPYGEPTDPALQPQDKVWKGPDPATGQPVKLPEGARCLVLEGADLAAVQADLAAANTETRWSFGAGTGKAQWRLAPRPLLPDETGCADLLS